jgi:hypothetical protein
MVDAVRQSHSDREEVGEAEGAAEGVAARAATILEWTSTRRNISKQSVGLSWL